MTPEDPNQEKASEQEQSEIPALVDRYWRLARSASNGKIANGLAAFEMAEILHTLCDASKVNPFSLVRSPDPSDCDIAMSNISILAENLWTAAQYKFGAKNHYFSPEYNEDRDTLIDGKTQKLEVKEAGEAGQGLYAREAIKKGGVVFVCSGSRNIFATPYESTELVEVPEEHYLVRPRNPDSLYPNAICIDQEALEPLLRTHLDDSNIKANIWLDPFETCPLRFLNHACEPNVKRRPDGVTFVAMRDIAPGEQLTCDYSTLEVNPDWKMQCKCGPTCRGTIGGIQSLPADLLQQYGTDLPRFMLDLFKESHRELDRDVLEQIYLTRWVMGMNQF